MLRILVTIILPLLLPTALYLLWFAAARHLRPAGAGPARALPWPWLAAAGVVLAAMVLYLIGVQIGGSAQGVYVPPRWEGGKIVPGHIEPPAPPHAS